MITFLGRMNVEIQGNQGNNQKVKAGEDLVKTIEGI